MPSASDTGAGRIIRVRVASGTPYQWVSSYYDWLEGLQGMEGDNEDLLVFGRTVNINGTFHELGGEPNQKGVQDWVEQRGNNTAMDMTDALGYSFIQPMEPLVYYGAQLGAEVQVVTTALTKPSGLVFLSSGRLAASDYATGDVVVLEAPSTTEEWNVVDTFPVGDKDAIMGIEAKGNKLYFADNRLNKVGIIELQC